MVTVYLCRHVETDDVVADRYHNDKGSSITPAGEEQVLQLIEALVPTGVSAVYSSPAERSKITARKIADRLGLPLEVLPFLFEWEPGHWGGLTREEVRFTYEDEYQAWNSDAAANAPRLGESLYEVAARVVGPLQNVLMGHEDQTVVIIGHNTVNRVILGHALGIPLADCRARLRQEPGGVTKLHFSPLSGWQLGSQLIGSTFGRIGGDGETVQNSMLSSSKFLTSVKTIQTRLTPIWPNGRDPLHAREGHHWVLKGHDRPVSVGRVESYFLYNIAAVLAPLVTVEIGTGFGYSAIWLAGGVMSRPAEGRTLISIDNHREGAIRNDGARFARESIRDVGASQIVEFVHGSSPTAIDAVVSTRAINLAFIDGDHHGSQPTEDFGAVERHAADNAVVVWHDVDNRYDVPGAFEQALNKGWKGKLFETSCNLGVTYRQDNLLPLILKAMESAENHQLIEFHQ